MAGTATRGRREDELAAPALPPAAMVQDTGRHDAGIGSSLAIEPASTRREVAPRRAKPSAPNSARIRAQRTFTHRSVQAPPAQPSRGVMTSLHDHDNTCRCLVVAARKQGGAVPLMTRCRTDSDMASPSLMGSASPLDRWHPGARATSLFSTAALGGHNLAVGIALEPHRREGGLIEGIIDQAAEVVRVGACEEIGIGDHDHAFPRIMAEEPCR